MDMKRLFDKPKNKALAKKISIKTPSAFAHSIKNLKKDGLTTEEKKALILAKTRAMLQLRRKNLSDKEREQFTKITRMKI